MAGMTKFVKVDHIGRIVPELPTKFVLLSVTEDGQENKSTFKDILPTIVDKEFNLKAGN
jgi:hypothetical protein